MEASLTGLCARAGLSSDLVSQAAEYQRTLQAKRAVLGVSATTQSIVCLHLAASQGGHSVETKDMVRLAGAKSKPHYLGILQNAEKVLQLDKAVSVQEVCVQLAVSHLAETAGKIITSYESHLKQTLGEVKFANLNLGRAVYPCAAVLAASKLRPEKIDQTKLTDLSRVKKKELTEIVEEMLKTQPKQDKSGVKRNLDLMDKIMGACEEKENSEHAVMMTKREKIQEDDFEDDGYEEWKQDMIRKAVERGFTQYKKYLKT